MGINIARQNLKKQNTVHHLTSENPHLPVNSRPSVFVKDLKFLAKANNLSAWNGSPKARLFCLKPVLPLGEGVALNVSIRIGTQYRAPDPGMTHIQELLHCVTTKSRTYS